tara:strand:- start:148 stop:1401 length:1254 start_codon:yes stop_codon:yes gene_type:complete
MSYFRIKIYLYFIDFIKSLFISNIENKKIETLIKKTSKKKNFILTSQLRVGFLILLQYLKKKFPFKKQIIFQSFNLPEMVNIASNLGFKPDFIGQDILTGQPNLKSLQKKIRNKTLAVIVTNIFNSPETLLKIKKICSKNNILLIEDNAIYFDNFFKRNNKKFFSGSFGDYSLYSFNIMKNISGFFGGGVSTNDKKFIEFAKIEISNYDSFKKNLLLKQILIFLILKILTIGILHKLFIKILYRAHKKDNKAILRLVYPSLKFKKVRFPRYYFTKISEIAKKVIYLQLTNTQNRSQNFSIRKNNNIYYYKLFKKLKINGVKLLKIEDFNFQNYMDFPILVTNKEKLNNYLLLNNIETKYLVYHNCAKIFGSKKEFKIQKNGKYFSDRVLGLPNHKKISKTYMNKIGYTIKKFYEKKI